MKIIGICGGSCSGKTYLARELEKANNSIRIISLDNYYFAHPNLTYEERARINYDVPESINIAAVIKDIVLLKRGQSIKQPAFSFETLLNYPNPFVTTPCDYLIVEGLFSLYYKELLDMIDLKVFVDTDREIRMARRISRDVEQIGRSLSHAINQYLNDVKPLYEKYIEPQKAQADLIVNGNKENALIIQLIMGFLKGT